MNIRIEKNRVKTISPYNVKMIKVLPHLEGMKRWGPNRSFTFENTPYNINIWKSVFPDATVQDEEGQNQERVAAEAKFDVGRTLSPFQFKTLPRDHQKRALEKFNSKKDFANCFGLLMDIGTGKSWTGIALMGQKWCQTEIDAVLLVAKNGVHSQWVNSEIPKHMSESVNWKAWIWSKTKKGEREFENLLQFDGLRIFAINIDALATKPAEEKILRFIQNAKSRVMMIVDESQDIKNISALRTQAAIKYGRLCKIRMIMTGTPIAKNLLDAFSQFKYLDDRIFGHKYMTTFRSKFCVLKDNGFGPEIIGHKNVEEFYRTIDPHVFRINADEVLDLPPKVYVTHEFVLSDEQRKMIKSLKQTFSLELSNTQNINVTHAASMLTKIQQVTCGFVVGENEEIHRFPNARLEALKNVLEQRQGKAIIWCRFNEDIHTVKKALGEVAVDYYGGTSMADRETNVKQFLDPGLNVLYLVASPEAAGTGLNLQGVCRTNIYYSNSFNSLARWQSEGRTWRDGTTGTVAYIDLIAKGGIDRKILSNLQDKKSISDLALDEYRKLILMEDNDEIFES